MHPLVLVAVEKTCRWMVDPILTCKYLKKTLNSMKIVKIHISLLCSKILDLTNLHHCYVT